MLKEKIVSLNENNGDFIHFSILLAFLSPRNWPAWPYIGGSFIRRFAGKEVPDGWESSRGGWPLVSRRGV
jgi:hypothetical protein